MNASSDILIVGGGVFGVTAALELRRRDYSVTLIDSGPIPHPLAASTDVSKVVRMEYGADRQYLHMADRSIDGLLAWNEEFAETFYHNTGVLMMASRPMQPGEYLYESYHALIAEGHRPERMDSEKLRSRFPAWNADRYVDGFFSARGGYVESGRLMAALQRKAQREGVRIQEGQTAERFLSERNRVIGVRTREGETFTADATLVATGAWTHHLLPELASVIKATGHPIFHLKPNDPTLFAVPNLVTFTADVEYTGWYGFPLLREGVIKVANHGVGVVLHAEKDERIVYPEDFAHLRAFLAETFPALLDAAIVYTRRCLYSDTLDGHFWIDHHPEKRGLIVAAGDSGHGFKFAPVLGPLTADVVERKPNAWAERFRWRTFGADVAFQEASRYQAKER
ncbi:MAG: FAD-dependent oxidoreductase [Caldilinea sp.]|nr:FAD-dependent oxidoreductase [Caldilinea sp.]MDW8439829.1 FAD-dependent oxidoreductase [Caldilineaceae bacterium]